MRRATLLCAFLAFLCFAPEALAQGGPAICKTGVKVERPQRVGGLALESGRYRITVSETGDLTCDQARDEFREIVSEPGNALPEGWELDLSSRTFSEEDGENA